MKPEKKGLMLKRLEVLCSPALAGAPDSGAEYGMMPMAAIRLTKF
jgi:hypothetical protein